MIDILKAIVFGIVEGITEWLPISSTGHLILLKQLMPLKVSESFWNMFEVVIQLGAILAVVLIFWHKIFPFRKERGRWHTDMRIINLWIKIIVACIPAAIIGLLFDDKINALFYNPTSVSIALIVFGVLFIVIENRNRRMRPRVTKLGQLTYQTAIIIGLFQVLAAVFPGTSRSGATIIGALLIGVSRTVAAEFTFFLAIPVMFGASLLKLIKFGFHFSGLEIGILVVGMVSAFIVSVIVIRFLMGYIKKHDFKVFGWYRIVLGIIVLLYFGLLVK
ncbi:MAG: undecaprenyl-diphosphate phosphatase [Clostridiales bacterium]|nr:undecaprenyl-diphosphate phosphatase [Clostridiales bacterium]